MTWLCFSAQRKSRAEKRKRYIKSCLVDAVRGFWITKKIAQVYSTYFFLHNYNTVWYYVTKERQKNMFIVNSYEQHKPRDSHEAFKNLKKCLLKTLFSNNAIFPEKHCFHEVTTKHHIVTMTRHVTTRALTVTTKSQLLHFVKTANLRVRLDLT